MNLDLEVANEQPRLFSAPSTSFATSQIDYEVHCSMEYSLA
jgi:hypothetical protein